MPRPPVTSIRIQRINVNIMKGKVKQHFLNLAVHNPRSPVSVVKTPAIIARNPNAAAGEGIP